MWYEYHDTDTHNTCDCSVTKNLKAFKSGSSGKPEGGFTNKTWQRKSNESKTNTKTELNALVKKESKKAIHKVTKNKENRAKRKRKSDDSNDDSSFNSLNAIDESMKKVEQQLAEFDFSKDTES